MGLVTMWEGFWCWAEHHPGVASWVQAFGAIVSIWGAFAISRSQQKAQLKQEYKAAQDKSDALLAVVESAVMFVSSFGDFVRKKPAPFVFKENWKMVNRQWLESSIFSLSQLPAHELGSGEMVRGYFGIMGAVNEIGELINGAIRADAFQDHEFTYMYGEVLKQVRFVESNWRELHQAASLKSDRATQGGS